MATWVYPPVAPDELTKLEDETIARELQWLLASLQLSLASLKDGLEECVTLLAPKEPGSTLVLSSLRSESIKGFVTRVGTKIVKGPFLSSGEYRDQHEVPVFRLAEGILFQHSPKLEDVRRMKAHLSLQDIHLRLQTLPPNTPRTHANSTPSTRLTLTPSPNAADLVLPQLLSVRALINDSLDIIDVSRWTGQSTDASFISGQLKLLHDYLIEARASLKGPLPGEVDERMPGGKWWKSSSDDMVFEPPLPGNVSLHFTIQDANLVLTVRTLAPASPSHTPSTPTSDLSFSLSGFNLRSKLLGLGSRLPTHDEIGETFRWRDSYEVTVREKVRVETGDPSLMSVAAKLSALEHEVARWRENLRIVMGEPEDDD